MKKWIVILSVFFIIVFLTSFIRPGQFENPEKYGMYILLGFVALIFIVYFIDKMKIETKKIQEHGTKELFSIGKYVVGLPQQNWPVENVMCGVSERNFDFFGYITQDKFENMGSIPRDSITEIIIDDKSLISKRITVPRLLALGIFALAVQKKEKIKEYCLVIDWDDERGIRQNTVFEFSGSSSDILANTAANALKSKMLAKASRLKADEKKCPYCAEIIKSEAVLCKHCGSKI